MKERVFIDTGFWIALIDKRDQNHIHAKKSLKPLLTKYNVCSSEFVVFETLTYINCSLKRHDLALKYLNKMDDPGIHVFPVDETTKIKALQLFRSYLDKNLSVTDCTSFGVDHNSGHPSNRPRHLTHNILIAQALHRLILQPRLVLAGFMIEALVSLSCRKMILSYLLDLMIILNKYHSFQQYPLFLKYMVFSIDRRRLSLNLGVAAYLNECANKRVNPTANRASSSRFI
jgi:predicted nucleic acid-binding protein